MNNKLNKEDTKENNKVTGKSAGGLARSQKLTPEQRKEIAKKAAIARWGKKPLKAVRRGNFKEDFGIDVDCYVLDNEISTAVISQRGMAEALGLAGGGGTAFIRFTSGATIGKYIGPELEEKIKNPIVFQSSTTKSSGPEVIVYGYDVTILIDVCEAILRAERNGELKVNQKHVADQAKVLLSASAKSGIQELVYKLAGFDSTKEQFVQAFKRFVVEEAKKYEKEFPVELYVEWARIYNLTIPSRGWPWEFKTLTINHIYTPLAKSNGKILELLRITKSKGGDRKDKLFQFLNDVGTRALRMQLGRVLEMAESSKNRKEYEQKVIERFGGQAELDIVQEE